MVLKPLLLFISFKANRYLNTALPQCYIHNKKRKKRSVKLEDFTDWSGKLYPGSIFERYGSRVKYILQQTFKIALEKRGIPQSIAINWLHIKLSSPNQSFVCFVCEIQRVSAEMLRQSNTTLNYQIRFRKYHKIV